jgi:acyl carrier protein
MTVENKVREIIAEELDMDINLISVDSSFEELGVDSLTGIEILLAMENAFDKEFSEDAEPPKTVREVIDFINS